MADLPGLLGDGDVLVVNESRVLRARVRARKVTGGRAELLFLGQVEGGGWECLVGGSGLKEGSPVVMGDDEGSIEVELTDERGPGRYGVSIPQGWTAETVMERWGEMPTPPYIRTRLEDQVRYQTTYARVDGSVAAPTAGLHFNAGLLSSLDAAGVSLVKLVLHVGYGTFQSVRVERVEDHLMEEERIEISGETAEILNGALDEGRRVFAVGTTTVRALESATDDRGRVKRMRGPTDLFIYPGYEFRFPYSGLITNFHLPRSTLLMLVSAYAGLETMLSSYSEAVARGYRFYSLGDGMIIQGEGTDGGARTGVLSTTHGDVPTPVFMPVATGGSVRTLSPDEVWETGARALIANSYSLLVRPGVEAVEEAGGLHGFMGWPGAIFTDSGGFQMVRKGFLVRKDDRVVVFRDHVKGSVRELTPEGVVELQERLGSDVAMVLDDCPPAGAPREVVEDAVRRTSLWAHQCLDARGRKDQLLFAISQGGIMDDLRLTSSKELAAMDFDGYGIGGLSIGEPVEEMWRVIDASMDQLPVNAPRYLMGVGSPREVIGAITRGVDVFDAAYPTRVARHGTVLTRGGRFDITRGKNSGKKEPLDSRCGCRVCQDVDRAYVHHLWRSKDTRWMELLSFHNLHLMQDLVSGARAAIERGAFAEFRREWERAGTSEKVQ
jgi:queuine tRNA-ribosyltransferase